MNILRNLVIILVATAAILLISSFDTPTTDFDKKWEEVEKLTKKGRPQSALAIVKDIYTLAREEHNNPQIIKSLIYQASLQSRFEEDYIVKSIELFKNNLKDATSPEKQILESLIAEMYQSYYNANRWTINKLKITNDDNTDISTWDAVKFNREISKYYMASVCDDTELSKIPLKDYSDILIHADSSETTLFPYLFDLLANRAINYFSSSDYDMATLGNENDPKVSSYLIPTSDFMDVKINYNASQKQKVLWLYQRLLHIHSKNNNLEAFVDLDLKRLKYVYAQIEHTNQNQGKFIDILSNMAIKYGKQPVYSDIAYELANMYFRLSNDYSPEMNPETKYYLVTADSICNTAIDTYPLYNNTNKCRNLREIINRVDFNFDLPVAVAPLTPILGLVEYKNIQKLYFRIVEGDAIANADRHNHKEYIQREMRKDPVAQWEQELPVANDHRQHSVEIKFPELKSGYYVIFVSDNKDFSTVKTIRYSPISVTNLSYITNSNPEGGFNDLYVVDRETGKAIGLVNITVYSQRYENRTRSYTINKVANIQTDKYGYARVNPFTDNNYGTYLFEFDKDGDKLFSENYLSFFSPTVSNKPKTTTYFFTDRAIYRPGQTIYYKGIVIEKTGEEVSLVKNSSQEISFLNASRKEVSVQKMKTDETGSFDGSFTIPMGMMNGNMTIKTQTGSVRVKVENYKRPTFKVEFKPINEELKLDQNIKVTGIAEGYAGNAIGKANVKYKVVRNVNFPWPLYRDYRWLPPFDYKEVIIATGEVETNESGEFIIDFKAIADDKVPSAAEPIFSYEIIAEVTDISGEVQTNSTRLNVGAKSLVLTLNIPEEIEISDLGETSVSVKNINGDNIETIITIELYKLTPPNRLLNSRQWAVPEFTTIPEEEFMSDFPHDAYKDEGNPYSWPSSLMASVEMNIHGKGSIPSEIFNDIEIGEYLLVAKASDISGTDVVLKQKFTIYSSSGKKLPGNMINWYVVDKTRALPGETVKLIIGSAAKNSNLLYEVVSGNKIITRNWIKLSRKQAIIEIPVEESYRGNFSINLAMVRFNRVYTNTIVIKVPYTNRKLDIALETFRNHLTPGQKEEWKIIIKGENSTTVAANLLAGMYDASLDVFAKDNWDLSLYNSKRPASSWESNQFQSSWSSALFTPEVKFHKKKPIYFPAINWFGYKFIGYNPLYHDQSDMLYRKSVIVDADMGLSAFEDDEIVDTPVVVKDTMMEVEKDEVTIPLRTNFNETAFFFPNLKTDEEGNVSLSFTTPDALTEWKIRMLAFTDDLKVGTLEETIKSQKELMIIPNLPRFIRHGDTIVFTAKVVNFTKDPMNAKTAVQFFDGLTMKEIDILLDKETSTQLSEINAGYSAEVSWKIAAPENIDLLSYRIKSVAGSFADGEERMIPVLTNRILVTNSMPMYVGPNKTAVFDFNSIYETGSSTKRDYRYTIEFASNPSWYAVQAIPYLSKPQTKSSKAFFNMYYANSLSSYIINSNPKIKSVFELWKNTSPDAFLSDLEKNPELKNIVLEATPWVLDAEDEYEQKRRIALLFDLNKLKDEKDLVLDKLLSNQLASGAWPWFNGMREDIHTTQEIVLGMARLHEKGVIDINSDNRRFQMIRKAVNFLDKEMVSDYKDLLKRHPKTMNNYHITSSQTRYLYARTLLINLFPLNDNIQDAFDYYTLQLEKYWLKQSNYLQGMAAITLSRLGHRNESEAIVRSLKERSLFSKEMGMYWRNESGWHWYQAPVETQAMMIETMAELDNNPTLIEQMKVWLLRQKQTHYWKTSSATVEAVFALLMYGSNNLDNDDLVDISVGGETIDISGDPGNSSEAGTGYFTKTWSGSEITNDFANISVINPNSNIAWGAVYYQYFEDMDKVQSNSSPLNIKKELFKEQQSEEGTILVKIAEEDILNTGDKIVVRLQIISDRSIDYVHVKDMRASTFEPVNGKSGYSYGNGLWYYVNVTDVGTSFFIQHLNKGSNIIEYPMFVTQQGEFINGMASIQSMYAPEFGANTAGTRVVVKD